MEKVVLIGSSIFEAWYNSEQAFPDFHTVNRAMGGTRTTDWLEEDMLPVLKEEQPDIICMYCGSNDMLVDTPEKDIIKNIKHSRQLIADFNPKTRFAYFGIIKAPGKRKVWDKIERVNEAITEQLNEEDLYYEFNDIFFRDDELIEELFLEDQTHHPIAAYDKLVDHVKPVIKKWTSNQTDY